MPKKKITPIPATKPMFSSQNTDDGRKRRVAAYARVSTDSEEQATSFDAQVDYYTKMIQERRDWMFVGIYTDEGISGTSTKNREGFKRMMKDALDGKIDLIIAKSISRIARNTVDALTSIRKLKEKGIEFYFEKENIYTLDSKGELMITIMSSIAQEESRSISENVTWGRRKLFQDGKVSLPYSCFLGYKKGPDGIPEVVPEEAKTVRRIYRLYLEGETPHGIARLLTSEGIPTPGGKEIWQGSSVESILTNEKYKGDALLQKKFTVDFLTKKQKVNEGEVPQYYVEGSHEAIIPPQVFDLVQYEMQRRKDLPMRYSSENPFSSRIICGECGGIYSSKHWHSTDKYHHVVWLCNRRYRNHDIPGNNCHTPHLTEEEIKEAFIGAFNRCIENKEDIIENCKLAVLTVLDTNKLEKKAAELSTLCEAIEEKIRKCIEENAHISADPALYAGQYEGLAESYKKKKSQLDSVIEQIKQKQIRQNKIEIFLDMLLENKSLITEFSTQLWNMVIDSVKVYSRQEIIFVFKGGTEIKWSLE